MLSAYGLSAVPAFEHLYFTLFIRELSLILPGGDGRHLGGGPKFCSLRGRGMKNKEHFRRSMEFIQKSWSWDQNFYANLRGRTGHGPPNGNISYRKNFFHLLFLAFLGGTCSYIK